MGTNNFNNFTTIYKDYALGAINQIVGMHVKKHTQILCKTSFLKNTLKKIPRATIVTDL